MIHVVAPNGLLVRNGSPCITNPPCGVGWTSTPSEAHQFESPAASLQWAHEHAPVLATLIGVVITQPVDAPRKEWGDIRFVSVGIAT